MFRQNMLLTLLCISVATIATTLSGCGGGGDSALGRAAVNNSAAPTGSVNPQVVPLNAPFRGKNYAQWEASFWQWALALPVNGPLPHPFADCSRPISAGQTGNVWYWSAPDILNEVCNQSATVIPAGTSIFLSTLDVEVSSLDSFPTFATNAQDQQRIASQFADRIQDLFVSIDNVPITDITAYRVETSQFSFTAPTPWIFNTTGGSGTSVGDGYFLMLKPLSPGSHTIHYGGRFHFLPGDFGPGQPLPPDIVKDTTLLITVGAD